MDATRNPFAPGAGSQPPALTGRDGIIADATTALARVRQGRPERSQMLLGLRGVGKTVLLNVIERKAEDLGYLTIMLEAPEDRRLADLLVPALRRQLYALSRKQQAKDLATRALGVLRAFASAFKVKVGEMEIGVEPEAGTADSGLLESDLPELLVAVAQAAAAADTPVALLIDEIQYLPMADLAALIVSTHKIAQKGLPFLTFGAGLPQVAGLAGEAKSYAERLFRYPEVGPLSEVAAYEAIQEPLRLEGVDIDASALRAIYDHTQGYPYFLQEWGSHTWNAASGSPVTVENVAAATTSATQAMDNDFFRVRMDRLTPREKDYLRAMAELGAGPHRSGDIARALGVRVQSVGPLRDGLIRKGMVFSPAHGDTAFTVPMFDAFMRRAMPTWTPVRSRTPS
jgi:hypothetical protein